MECLGEKLQAGQLALGCSAQSAVKGRNRRGRPTGAELLSCDLRPHPTPHTSELQQESVALLAALLLIVVTLVGNAAAASVGHGLCLVLCPVSNRQRRYSIKNENEVRCLKPKWVDRHMAGVSLSVLSSGHVMVPQCVTTMDGECLASPDAGFSVHYSP